jgi:hypothetical protein
MGETLRMDKGTLVWEAIKTVATAISTIFVGILLFKYREWVQERKTVDEAKKVAAKNAVDEASFAAKKINDTLIFVGVQIEKLTESSKEMNERLLGKIDSTNLRIDVTNQRLSDIHLELKDDIHQLNSRVNIIEDLKKP